MVTPTALTVFDGEDSPESLDAMAYWQSYIEPDVRPQNLEHHRWALTHFASRLAWCGPCNRVVRVEKHGETRACSRCRNTLISDPGVSQFDDRAASELVESMRQDPADYSPATIRRLRTYVGQIFKPIVKAGHLHAAPEWPKLPKVDPNIRVAAFTELVAVLDACKVADWPIGLTIDPPTYWRCLIVWLLTYGQRIGEAFTQPWETAEFKRGRLNPGIYLAELSPHPRGRLLNLTSPHGWMIYHSRKTESSKPTPICHPLNAATRCVVDIMRPHTKSAVFPLGLKRGSSVEATNYRNRNKSLNRVWGKILTAAGVVDPFTRHDMRRTAETIYDESTNCPGSVITGHAARTVSDQSYAAYYRRAAKAICRELFEMDPRDFPVAYVDCCTAAGLAVPALEVSKPVLNPFITQVITA